MYFPMREGIKNLYSASAELQKIYNRYRRTGNTDRSERGDEKKNSENARSISCTMIKGGVLHHILLEMSKLLNALNYSQVPG